MATLEEFGYFVSDKANLIVYDMYGSVELATYDGHDSIPEALNGFEVCEIQFEDDWGFHVFLNIRQDEAERIVQLIKAGVLK